ncbi:MAG: four helix bundle protein [Verrucomicrobiota bacterium]
MFPWQTDLAHSIKKSQHAARIGPVLDQLERASSSVTLNIAEGNGRRSSRQRAKFFDDARGSATECAGCLDILVAKNVITVSEAIAGKALLIRCVSILSKLVQRFDKPS